MRRAFWSPRVWIRRLGWKLIELTEPAKSLRPRGAPPPPRDLPPPPIKRIPVDQRAIEIAKNAPAQDVVVAPKDHGIREIPLRRSNPMPVTMTAEEREAQRVRRQSGK